MGPRVLPKLERDWKRINIEPAPPCALVTRAMKLAVMDPADWDETSLTIKIPQIPEKVVGILDVLAIKSAV